MTFSVCPLLQCDKLLLHLALNKEMCPSRGQTFLCYHSVGRFSGGLVGNLLAIQETQLRSLAWEDALEEEMATHSSILAWRTPWTEEPDGQGLQRVGHD